MIKKLGVEITTWNRAIFNDQCLKSLIWSNPKHSKIVVIDNLSTDDTREKVFPKYKDFEYIDIVLNDNNNGLGYAVNQGWDIMAESCDCLGWINNDFLFEPGWEQNLLNVFNDLDLDYIHGMPNSYRTTEVETTENGGRYRTRIDMGAAFFIRTDHFKRGITPEKKPFRKGHSGPGPGFYNQVRREKLKGVKLASPAIHKRYEEYNNPEMVEYYNSTFGTRGLMKKLTGYRTIERNEKLKNGLHWQGGLNWEEFKEKFYPNEKEN